MNDNCGRNNTIHQLVTKILLSTTPHPNYDCSLNRGVSLSVSLIYKRWQRMVDGAIVDKALTRPARAAAGTAGRFIGPTNYHPVR